MSIIPEGYDLVADSICTFSNSDKTYNGIWYHCDDDNSYYFCLGCDVSFEEMEEEIENCLVVDENIVCDENRVHGWFSKTMEEYNFIELGTEIEDQSDEEESYAPDATGSLPEGMLEAIWGCKHNDDESDDDDNF